MDVDKAVIARLKKNGKDFEVLVDCEKALAFKKTGDFNEVLVSDKIYKDNKKGMVASEGDLKSFDSENFTEIAKEIVKDGEVQLTTEYRNNLREEKKKQVIELIHRNSVDSNGLPHPISRIETALEEVRVKIDEFKDASEQIKDIVDKLRSVLPIKFEIKKIYVKIPAQHTGKVFSVIKKYETLKENWENDGSLVVELKIPAGLVEEFYDELNKMTHGDVETKDLKGE
ncbi:ribosome assembly factor SBDS [archaeon]|nr:ribosome assembly factor SBDS [archaeon]|tara:strand:+ start:198 stop:881 length:684 start_codon:yes stop_codon:yes gene_type:complete